MNPEIEKFITRITDTSEQRVLKLQAIYAAAPETEKIYNTVSELPAGMRADIQELIDAGALRGEGGVDRLALTYDMARVLIIGKRYTDSRTDR